MLGYVHKFGYDELAEEMRQRILQIDPQNLTALIVGANLKTQEALDKYIAAGKPPLQELDKYPAVQAVRQEMLAAYERVDGLGYQDMPSGAYQRWLRSIEQEKNNGHNKPCSSRYRMISGGCEILRSRSHKKGAVSRPAQ
ncbi:hypothetical protein [Paraflavitalea speifideaquila]|uniref:hypothetical protein n=1 Tax=Paraflavitalea speifideaquila TaxID=3076558 RepID=UPI0028EAB2F0|nr:hypothetical protein [Paraflavitalea speifideiaquila]